MLYLVGVPVGNWQDMPPRNIELIKNAKNLIVENEPNFQEILRQLKIDKSNANIMYIDTNHSNYLNGVIQNEAMLVEKTLELLSYGEDVYVISDEGMPGISDPGEILTVECIKAGYKISATPGPSSIIAAASVAGCQQNFSFEGFLSKENLFSHLKHKKNLQTPMIFMLRNSDWSGAFQPEIEQFLDEALKMWGDRRAVLCYNLTTNEERVIYGLISYLKKYHVENRKPEDKVMIVVDGIIPMLCMPKV